MNVSFPKTKQSLQQIVKSIKNPQQKEQFNDSRRKRGGTTSRRRRNEFYEQEERNFCQGEEEDPISTEEEFGMGPSSFRLPRVYRPTRRRNTRRIRPKRDQTRGYRRGQFYRPTNQPKQRTQRRRVRNSRRNNRRKKSQVLGVNSRLENGHYLRHEDFTKQLSRITSNSLHTCKQGGYNKRVTMFKPLEQKAGNDRIRVKGSEFLTFVSVNPTGATYPTQPGYWLYTQPMNPRLFSGTRIAQYANLYEKFYFNHSVMEFVTNVAATQDGSLVMYFTYDPAENTSNKTASTTELLRFALGHQGANIFSVYENGRAISTPRTDNELNYYVDLNGEDAREEMQSYFVLQAGSRFTNTTSEAITLGVIWIHYDITFSQRNIQSTVMTDIENTIELGTTVSAIFVNTSADSLVTITAATFGGTFIHTDLLLMIYTDARTSPSSLPVYDDTGAMELFLPGSVWYGRKQSESSGNNWFIYSTLEQALDPNSTDGTLRLTSALVGANEFTASLRLVGKYLTDPDNA